MTTNSSTTTSRRSLRDRCDVDFYIDVSSITAFNVTTFTWHENNPSYHGPRKDNLPRRSKGNKKPFPRNENHDHQKDTVKQVKDNTAGAKYWCLQELIPDLFVAFSDGPDHAKSHVHHTSHSSSHRFTHVITIDSATGTSTSGGIDTRISPCGKHHLRLILPSPASQTRFDASLPSNPRHSLTPDQILASCDFVSLALSYNLAGTTLPPSPASYRGVDRTQRPSSVQAKVLILTPGLSPELAMSVAGCYMSFVLGESVRTVLKFIDEDEEVMGWWKGTVDWENMKRLKAVAKSRE